MATSYETLKLLTNIPVAIDRLHACYYSKSKTEGWSDQLQLRGSVGGKDVRIYIPLALENELGSRGWIERIPGKVDNYGQPAFKTNGNPKFTLLKTEEGTQKYVTVQPHDFVTNGPALHKPQPTPQQATHAPKSAGGGPSTHPDPWSVLEATYAKAVGIARRSWVVAGKASIPDDLLMPAAATVFIEANRQGLRETPGPMAGTEKAPNFGPPDAPLPDEEPPLDDDGPYGMPF